uniref:LYR motif containing 4 n=1 Tax=Equus asinus TaxID=9793 RepID=A0A9L0J2X5_EQUAS
MAASSRAQVLDLYRAMLRESKHFSAYNYRTYAVRRIRDAFRENKNVKDPVEIQALVNKAKRDLEIIRRQTGRSPLPGGQQCGLWGQRACVHILTQPTDYVTLNQTFNLLLLIQNAGENAQLHGLQRGQNKLIYVKPLERCCRVVNTCYCCYPEGLEQPHIEFALIILLSYYVD